MLGYVVTVIVTISLALGNTLPLPVVSPASDPRADHSPRQSPSPPPARNVRNENECISDSDKYPGDPTASRGTARPLYTLRNEQVIAMGRAFIIMPACCAFVAYTHRIPSTRAALFDPIERVPTILNTGHPFISCTSAGTSG